MGQVAVVTDSTHYMPREVAERHGFHTVSLYVRWGDPPRDDREAELPDFDGFYDHLRSARELPTTSQPSVGDFLAVYEPLLERGDDILSVHLSGGISGTVRSAEQARDQLAERGIEPDRIVIVDSASVCAGLGLLAVAAANAAADGAGVAEAAARARAVREKLNILFAVDTLEFLRRGGRIGGAQAWIGATLKIKPILAIESEVVPVEAMWVLQHYFPAVVRCHCLVLLGWKRWGQFASFCPSRERSIVGCSQGRKGRLSPSGSHHGSRSKAGRKLSSM